MAKSAKNIEFIPRINDSKNLSKIIAEARGFIFPSLEPFGIAPIEALATGTPVLALNQGGAQDYIMDGVNGVFFESQSVDEIIKSVKRFEKMKFNLKEVSKTAKRFSKDNFKKNFEREVRERFNEKF